MIAEVARVELYAVDIDSAAVACARKNLAPLGGHVLLGDLFGPLPEALHDRVNVLTANVPYIPSAAISFLPAEARLHEPRIALEGGEDGLDVLRRLVADAHEWLAPGGNVLMETSDAQANTALEIMRAAGLGVRVTGDDRLDATVVIGSRTS
jgi:release factor glutamine methyltransferase